MSTPRASTRSCSSRTSSEPRVRACTNGGDEDVPDEFDALLERRRQREPLAYVLGEWGFRRLVLNTDARALVPRPETEIVVERCLALLRDEPEPRVLDLGTGSGAIALAIADERPDARVTAVDSAEDAVALARENAERLDLAIEVRQGDLEAAAEGWDLVVSNPPYVAADEWESLQPEIRDWEPRSALVGEGIHEEIARLASTRLLVFEVGDGQADHVADALASLGYARHHDHSGSRRGGPRRRGTTMTARRRGSARRRAGRACRSTPCTGWLLTRTQEQAVRRLYELKGRAETDPSALVARDFDYLLECVPELSGQAAERARLLLPGPVTLILPNPAGRFRWFDRDEPGGDRRSGSRVRRAGRRRPRACRRRRRNQREPSRRPRSEAARRGAPGDPGWRRGTGRRRRAARQPVDRDRPHRPGAAHSSGGSAARRRGSASTGRGSTIRLTPGEESSWPSRSRPFSS